MDRECIPAEEAPQTPRNKKKSKMNNKKRFSDEQIRLLESIFESETKLEPRKKMQPARDLELQPRQVAIWFQNRRARWKSKQMEQDYNTLKANYGNLELRFESLKKEKQCLMLQMQKLSEVLGDPNKTTKAVTSETEAEAQPSFGGTGLKDKEFLGLQQTVKDRDDVQQTGLAWEEFLIMDEYRNESPASPEKLYGLDSPDMFDHSCTNSQWLKFWT